MKISIDVARYIQKRLFLLTMDCDYAASFFSGLPKMSSEDARWQLAIDIIYRLLLSGLVVPGHQRKKARDLGVEIDQTLLKNECRQYMELLSKTNPYILGGDDVAWYMWDLCSSKSGNELMKKHMIDSCDEPLSEKLIEEIEILFEVAGVPWTGKNPISIQTAA